MQRRKITRSLVCVLLICAGCAGAPSPLDEEAIARDNVLGTAYLGQLEWAEAEQAFGRALERRPNDPVLLTNAAIAVRQQERLDEAIELLRRAIATDPDFAPSRYQLGLIEAARGNYDEAAVQFAGVARTDPQDQFTRYYLGTALARIGREDEAEDELRAALERDPTHVSTLYALGRLLLQRGNETEGLELVRRSQEIRSRSGLDQAVGTGYGEQGPYSIGVDFAAGALEAPAPIETSLRRLAQRTSFDAGPAGIAWTRIRGADGTGVRVVAAEDRGVVQIYPPQDGSIVPLGPAGTRCVALTAVDVDDDARLDLVGLILDGSGRLRPGLWPSHPNGAFGEAEFDRFTGAAERNAAGLTAADLIAVDRDHDGDLDLFWCLVAAGAADCRVATNDGSGRFEARDAAELGITVAPAEHRRIRVAMTDADNDRDVDLIVGSDRGLQLYANRRDGSFADVSHGAGLGAGIDGSSSAIVDLNKDGWMDLLVASDSGPVLLANRRGRFDDAKSLLPESTGPGAALVWDFDNDGFLDLAVGSATGVTIWRNGGAGRFVRAERMSFPDAPAGSRPLTASDLDDDGDLDLVVAGDDATLTVLENDGGNTNHWLAIDSKGVGDNRFGVGAKIEILAGSLRQKFELTHPVPLHAGLGRRDAIQSARYLWPSGVLQDEVGLEAGRTIEVEQLDRKGTSCPLLYAYRDGRWRFVTDFLGGAAVGYRLGPGTFNTPDTDEYVVITSGLTPDADGKLRLRVNNQLEEVIWFDRLELVAVDHPHDSEVLPDERLMPEPPFPPFRLFASNDIRGIVSARSVEQRRDVTERLARLDRAYVDGFRLLRPKGYAEMHTLELDLGPFDANRRVVLVMDGWIDYADSSANVAASQAGMSLTPPRLAVADGRGGWTEASDSFGFPAGLPKAMTVELTGRFPSADHRVRLTTNMRIYWDRVRVMLGGEATPLHVRRIDAIEAELRPGGFPREVTPDGKKPHGYDPDIVAPTGPWKAHVGRYSAFGNVLEELAAIDDRFVTTRNGDEIVLTFPSPAPPDPGWRRTYLLFADGFGKDMDPNSGAPDRVGPLPYHGMPRYPYADEAGSRSAHADDRSGRYVWPAQDGAHGAPPRASMP